MAAGNSPYGQAPHDGNFVPAIGGTSNDGQDNFVPIQANPATGRLLVDVGGSGTFVVNTGTNIVVTAGTIVVNSGTINVANPITIAGGTVAVTGVTVNTGTTNINVTQIASQPVVTTGSPGVLPVGGDVPDSVADGGNPVKVGAIQLTTQPTYTNGQRTTLQSDTRGNLHVSLNGNNSGTGITGMTSNSDNNAVSGTQNRLGVASNGYIYNPSEAAWDRQSGQGTYGIYVLGALSTGSTMIGGPVIAGGVAYTTNPTPTSGTTVIPSTHDKVGKQVVVNSIRTLKSSTYFVINNNTGTVTAVNAVANTFLDVYGVVVTNNAAASNIVTFQDSANGATRFAVEVPAGDTRGFTLTESAAINQSSAGNIWQATCSTSGSIGITLLTVQNV
jgi:hypothetical protein